jgi:hypothetical protein
MFFHGIEKNLNSSIGIQNNIINGIRPHNIICMVTVNMQRPYYELVVLLLLKELLALEDGQVGFRGNLCFKFLIGIALMRIQSSRIVPCNLM